MEGFAVLVVLFVIAVPLVTGIWLIVRAIDANRKIEELGRRIFSLETQVARLRESPPSKAAEPSAPMAETEHLVPQTEAVPAQPAPEPPAQQPGRPPPVILEPEPVAMPSLTAPAVPPPLPTMATTAAQPSGPLAPVTEPESSRPQPPPLLPLPQPPVIDWEQFMGVKMFAWIGGLALFLGVVFFVKYSFEHNWISPELRVSLGFLTGLGLVIGGIRMSRKDFPTLSQTLCATGIVILYAVTFACRSFYHFAFFETLQTFLVMVVITAAAFLLAVRLDALVVAILGMLGGFLTPILLRTHQDNPAGLFGYIAILDIGLLLVASRRRWFFLAALAAVGTVLMQIGWAQEFFVSQHYPEGNKIFIALAVLLGFCLLYLAVAWQAKRAGNLTGWLSGGLLGLAGVAFCFALWFLDFSWLAQRPAIVFGFVLLVDLVISVFCWLDEKIGIAESLAGLAVFLLLGVWTNESLNRALLNTGLALYLVFAILHTAFPVLRQRLQGVKSSPGMACLFAPMALLLVLIPVFRLSELGFLIWPVVLLIDLLAIGLAALTAMLLPVLAVLLLTLAATAGLLLKIPPRLDGLPAFLILLGAFSVFFAAIGFWFTWRFKPEALRTGVRLGQELSEAGDLAVTLPTASAALPFVLLVMAAQRLTLSNPSPVFGLALLLVLMLLGITRLFSLDWMPAVALVCVTAVECSWHFSWFTREHPQIPLIWYLLFLAVFSWFPFLFARRFSERVVPWAIAALAGLPQFFLVHRLVVDSYPNKIMGLLPAAFAVPSLVGLLLVLKRPIKAREARLGQSAWFGGVTLFFVTLIFPIQFERQWLTLGWALEGAALLWLFLRVPHEGLRLGGIGLLVTAFVRLTLNIAVLEYERRSATPVFNWYLYTYGIVTACLFAGAWLVKPSKAALDAFKPRGLLVSLGTILAFWLMNIEIFDCFTPPGARIRIEFGGNFTRDMTFSIAWALFALMLLIVGITKKQRAFRYAGLALLSVTLIKLFFYDLAQLQQLYRIGAFVAVATIAMVASFAYQRFFSAALKKTQPKDEASAP